MSIEKLFSILIVLTILPILVLGIYNHPSADDLNYSYMVHWCIAHGLYILAPFAALVTNIGFWLSWQGLYSSAFIMAIQPAAWGEDVILPKIENASSLLYLDDLSEDKNFYSNEGFAKYYGLKSVKVE